MMFAKLMYSPCATASSSTIRICCCCSSIGGAYRESSRPGIDQLGTKTFEVAHVAGRDNGLSRGSDAGDLHIADLDRTTCAAPLGGDSRRGLRREFVERHDA